MINDVLALREDRLLNKKHMVIDIDPRFASILKNSTMVAGKKYIVLILCSYKREVSSPSQKETTSRWKTGSKSAWKEEGWCSKSNRISSERG